MEREKKPLAIKVGRNKKRARSFLCGGQAKEKRLENDLFGGRESLVKTKETSLKKRT